MKFVDITTFYSTGRGGITTYLERKSRLATQHSNFGALEHRLILAGAEDQVSIFHGSKCYWVKSPSVGFNPNYRYLINYFRISQILKRSDPDIIETPDPYWLPFYLLLWRRLRRLRFPRGSVRRLAKIFLFYRSDFPDTYVVPFCKRTLPFLAPLARRVCWSYLRFILVRMDGILVHSQVMKEKLEREGVKNSIHVVGNLTDFEAFAHAVPDPEFLAQFKQRFPEGGAKLLYCGRLSTEKGIELLLQLHKHLQNDPTKPVLVIMGSGPHAETISKLANDSANRIFFMSATPDRAKIAGVFAAADLLLIPGAYETFSQVTLEAIVAGLPVAALRGVGGVSALVQPGVGYLCESGDAESFLQTVRTALHPKKSWYRQEVRQSIMDTYQPNRVLQNILQAYSSRLSHKGLGLKSAMDSMEHALPPSVKEQGRS